VVHGLRRDRAGPQHRAEVTQHHPPSCPQHRKPNAYKSLITQRPQRNENPQAAPPTREHPSPRSPSHPPNLGPYPRLPLPTTRHPAPAPRAIHFLRRSHQRLQRRPDDHGAPRQRRFSLRQPPRRPARLRPFRLPRPGPWCVAERLGEWRLSGGVCLFVSRVERWGLWELCGEFSFLLLCYLWVRGRG